MLAALLVVALLVVALLSAALLLATLVPTRRFNGRGYFPQLKVALMQALSLIEQAQLGSVRLRRNGEPSTHPWPSATQWPKIRTHLVQRSLRANPALDPDLTAYTPGETLGLLARPEISA